MVMATIITLFFFGLIDEPFAKIIDIFREKYSPFFWPLKRFFEFFRNHSLITALNEETLFRGPIRILVGFILFFRKQLNLWLLCLVWLTGLVLNYWWATAHIGHELVWIPVFVAGLAWLWLVIKTNRLWPAICCHVIANLSIYLLIKIYQFLY